MFLSYIIIVPRYSLKNRLYAKKEPKLPKKNFGYLIKIGHLEFDWEKFFFTTQTPQSIKTAPIDHKTNLPLCCCYESGF
jgi:hypothetical protein